MTHALALGITAILISGLLFTTAALLEDQRENSAREQLRTVGNRIADDLSRAAVLAQDGGNVTIRTDHPTTVAGRSYHVAFLTRNDCDTDLFDTEACLQLELQDGGTSVMVPVRNETAVTFEQTADGTYNISAVANESAEPASVPGVRRDLRVGIGDDVGEFDSGSTLNLTNRDPIAGFTFTPGQPAVNTTVHFQNDTKDLDGIITDYEWEFCDSDGNCYVHPDHAREINESFSEPDRYTVTLTVTDDDGETDNVSKVISVGGLTFNEDATAVNVTGGPTYSDVNFTVKNHHNASVEVLEVFLHPYDDSITRLEGEGVAAEIEIAGDVDSGGDDAGSPIQIHEGGRIVDLADDGSDGSATLSAGSNTTVWLRGFEDSTGTDQDMNGKPTSVSLRYRMNGSYYTAQFTLFAAAVGNEPPIPGFDYTCGTPPDCSFTEDANDPDGTIQEWNWQFGDGGTSTNPNPSHTFPSNGTYDVSLTVRDDVGVTSTVTKTVLVGDPGPPVVFAVNAGGNQMSVDGITYERDTEANPHLFQTGDNNEDGTSDDIDNTTADGLYQSIRHGDEGGWTCCPWTYEDPGSFGYDVPVPNGEYRVTFEFAEIEWGWNVDNGERRMEVDVEDGTEVFDVDVYDSVGTDYALTVSKTVNVNDGELAIEFVPDSNDLGPMVNAIVVRQLDAVSYQEDEGTPERLVMEAENYHRSIPGNAQDASGDDMSGDTWITIGNASASSNTALDGQSANGPTGAGDTENGPRLDYYADVNATGTYYVWVRMSCGNAASDAVHVGLDGQPATYGGSGLDKNASTYCHNASGWMWASHAAGGRAQVDIDDPGQHTINVWMKEDEVKIDKVLLTTDSTYEPSATGPAESPES